MHVPLVSIITLCTELLVTASVYSIVWKGYTTGRFLRLFAFAVLAYELVFNVSYMFSRELGEQSAGVYNPYETGLAIFHGIFSLVMFATLVAFFFLASRGYKRGENYFLAHRRVTLAFVVAWGISILSGVTLFVSLYVF